jgi:hypothetical protein
MIAGVGGFKKYSESRPDRIARRAQRIPAEKTSKMRLKAIARWVQGAAR